MSNMKRLVNKELIEHLASIFCSTQTIAVLAQVSEAELEEEYASVVARGRALGEAAIRRKQFEIALRGNVQMLIWLEEHLFGIGVAQGRSRSRSKRAEAVEPSLPLDLVRAS